MNMVESMTEIVKKESNVVATEPTRQGKPVKRKSKVSKTWEAAMRLKGSLVVYDPKFLL